MSWDPMQYLKYSSERLRPALDLLARIRRRAHRTRSSISDAARATSPRCSRNAGRARASSASTIRKRCWRRRAPPSAAAPGTNGSRPTLRAATPSQADRCGLQQCGAALAGRPRAVVPADLRLGRAGRRARGSDAGSICGAVARGDRGSRVRATRWRDRLAGRVTAVCGPARSRTISAARRGDGRGRCMDDGVSARPAGVRRRRAPGGCLDEGHGDDAVPRGARRRRGAGVHR